MEKMTEFVSKSFDPSKNALSVQYLAQSAARPDPIGSSSPALGLSENEVASPPDLRMSVPHLSLGLPLELARYHGLPVTSAGLPYPLPFLLAPRQAQLSAKALPQDETRRSASPSGRSPSPKRRRKTSFNESDEEDVEVDIETNDGAVLSSNEEGGDDKPIDVKREPSLNSAAQDSINNNNLKAPSGQEVDKGPSEAAAECGPLTKLRQEENVLDQTEKGEFIFFKIYYSFLSINASYS